MHLSYYVLRDVGAGETPPSSPPFSCPLCGSKTLINRVVTRSNQLFGSHWAVLLNPADAPSFSAFMQKVSYLNSRGVKFWVDEYTSDIEHYTSAWAYYSQVPTGPINFAGPRYNEAFAVTLSPAQLSQVRSVAPSTFAGIRFHEVPYRPYNPKVVAAVDWVGSHNIPLHINGGPTVWNDTWLPFTLAHRGITSPLTNNNWIGELNTNWAYQNALFQQRAVGVDGWSTQTFFILPLSKFQVAVGQIFNDPGSVPANPYFFYFAYEYSYGGTIFEVEPDQAIYSTTGHLTQTGRRIATFYRWFSKAPKVSPAHLLGQDGYGVIAVRASGKSRDTWMGPMQLSESSSLTGQSATVDYTVSGLPAGKTALIAIWNGSSVARPVGVTVNGKAVPIGPAFQAFAAPGPHAFYGGGQDLYLRSGNAAVKVTYAQAPVRRTSAPLRLDRGELFHVLGVGGPKLPPPTTTNPTVTCAGSSVRSAGTAAAATVSPGQAVFCSASFSSSLFPVSYVGAGFSPSAAVGADTPGGMNVAGFNAPSSPGSYTITATYVLAGVSYTATFPVTVS